MRNFLFVLAMFGAVASAFAQAPQSANAGPNPLLQEWIGPYDGVPPFDKIKVSDFKPALETAMAENLKEIDAIAKNSAAPTFENTVVAMERSGQLLTRVTTVFGILSAANTNPQIEALQTEMSPKLSAHSDAIYLDPALFARVRTLYETLRDQGLALDTLSIGMSQDFPAAIEEGATMVRIGSAIFGARPAKSPIHHA